MPDLMKHLPGAYKRYAEMRLLTDAQGAELDCFSGEAAALRDNQYFAALREDGVRYWEGRLGIIPNTQTESLSFRRERLQNRMGMRPPFTGEFLRRRLDSIIGAGRYELDIDHAGHTIYVESSAQDQLWYHEVRATINGVKPCNMVYINKPLLMGEAAVSGEISYSAKTYHYRLGTRWRLGQKTFASTEEKGVVKMAGTQSVQPRMLENLAVFAAGDIAAVLVNDDVEITEFAVKEAAGAVAVVEYAVSPAQTSEVLRLRLLDAAGQTLDDSSVYIPVAETAVIRHTIRMKEGV